MAKKKTKKQSGITLIKKANNLIESRYKFDIWETRVFLSVLSQIRREDDEFHEYKIWYKDIIKDFGLSSGDSYEYLRKAAKGLMKQQFTVKYYKEGVQREKAYQIIMTADYMSENVVEGLYGKLDQHEYISIKVHPEMKPFLLQLQKNFTAYDLKNVVKLSVYPVRIYELMKQYETIGWRILNIDELKAMFELKEEYAQYNDFYRFVIKKALDEIKKHTDLDVSIVEKIKESRRIVALKFLIKGKRSPNLLDENKEVLNIEPSVKIEDSLVLYENILPSLEAPIIEESLNEVDILFSNYQSVVVQKFGVTPSSFMELLKTVTEDQLTQAIRVTQRARANGQIISSSAGFFINALKNGFTDEKEEAIKQKRKTENKIKYDELFQNLKDERDSEINKGIRQAVQKEPNLTEDAILALKENPISGVYIENIELTLERSLETEDFRQDEMLRKMVKQQIISMRPKTFEQINETFEKVSKALAEQYLS